MILERLKVELETSLKFEVGEERKKVTSESNPTSSS